MLLCPFPFPPRCSSVPPAELLLPSIPEPAGAVPGVPWGAQTRQLQLLLFRFKCLHLFITKTPLRFPGSSTSWARELSEETHGSQSSAKTPPKTSTRLRPQPGGAGNRAGCLGGGCGAPAGVSRTFPCFWVLSEWEQALPAPWFPLKLSVAEPAIGRIIILIMIILITGIMLWQRDCSLSCPFVPPG